MIINKFLKLQTVAAILTVSAAMFSTGTLCAAGASKANQPQEVKPSQPKPGKAGQKHHPDAVALVKARQAARKELTALVGALPVESQGKVFKVIMAQQKAIRLAKTVKAVPTKDVMSAAINAAAAAPAASIAPVALVAPVATPPAARK